MDKLKESAANGMGRVQSFVLILGRVGLGHFTCGSGRVGSRKLDLQRRVLRESSASNNLLQNAPTAVSV